ncbi:hypothetical protein ETB97_012190 [Aspergillus alliaceus]|uniref:Uncharacterized protein n=1 Tax=Petromyces alliaceus TaxID=209559 RepID=A0A8H6A6P6_PETAA|nr:hypothetical protein ETB97_012190 [Aspergillus burnettii]
MSNSANRRRALERTKCREALSKYLESSLSILVAPSQVRLQPLPGDRYKWRYKEHRQYLFARQLSDLSTNSYIELCSALHLGEIWAIQIGEQEDLRLTPPDDDRQQSYDDMKRQLSCLERENEELRNRLLLHTRKEEWLCHLLAKLQNGLGIMVNSIQQPKHVA